jgi:heme-degrading monooxygenase HmoA
MITRVWHGRTSLRDADKYLDFLLSQGTGDYRKISGNLSVRVWRKLDRDCCHFLTVTEWESIDAIKEFAGEDYEKAVYYPEDNGVLLEFEEKVSHYESFNLTGMSNLNEELSDQELMKKAYLIVQRLMNTGLNTEEIYARLDK